MNRRIENIVVQQETEDIDQRNSFAFIAVIALTFVLFARPQDFFPILAKLRPALLFSFVALFFTFSSKGFNILAEPLREKNARLYFLFYCFMVMGIPFAYHRQIAFDHVILSYLNNIIFFLVLKNNIESIQQLKKIIFTIVICTIFYSSMSLLKSGIDSGRFSYGTIYDPNDLAFILVSLFPLSITFFGAKGKGKKLTSLVAFILAVVVIVKTGSRGGFIALGIVFAYLLFSKRVLSTAKKVFLLMALFGILAYQIDKLPVERYTTIIDLNQDYNIKSEFGRLSLWKRALEFSLSNPLTGVGVGCYSFALGYTREAEGILPRWQTAHSSYFLIAAEMGIPGILIFIYILIRTYKVFQSRLKNKNSDKSLETDTLAFPVYLSFIGLLVASAFISQSYSAIFTLYFAIGDIMTSIDKESGKQNNY
jgi:O-antigen ligase